MPKKIVFFVLGFGLLTAGIIFTLRDWLFLVMIFRGVIGPVLAVGGLILLALVKGGFKD
ncbi:MAG: hypothetical protein HQL17_00785 [Candidatus Omnitrophica bacterium]|nr:hypothetical protein [Candidatus Omnitrophota bacterium]